MNVALHVHVDLPDVNGSTGLSNSTTIHAVGRLELRQVAATHARDRGSREFTRNHGVMEFVSLSYSLIVELVTDGRS